MNVCGCEACVYVCSTNAPLIRSGDVRTNGSGNTTLPWNCHTPFEHKEPAIGGTPMQGGGAVLPLLGGGVVTPVPTGGVVAGGVVPGGVVPGSVVPGGVVGGCVVEL